MKTLISLLLFIPSLSWGSDDLTGKNLICKNLILNEIILIEFLKESDENIQSWIDAHIRGQKKSFENSIFDNGATTFKPNLDLIPELIPNYVYIIRGKITAKDFHESEIIEYRFNYQTNLETIVIYRDGSQKILKSRWGNVKDYGFHIGTVFRINRQELSLHDDDNPYTPYECELAKKYEIKEWKEDLILRFEMEEYHKNKENEERKNELKKNQKI